VWNMTARRAYPQVAHVCFYILNPEKKKDFEAKWTLQASVAARPTPRPMVSTGRPGRPRPPAGLLSQQACTTPIIEHAKPQK